MKMMNKLIALLSIALLTSCGGNKEQKADSGSADSTTNTNKITLTIKGSDTVLPLSQKESEEYMKLHPEAAITIVGGGSGVGITALMDGTTDIAMSSRPLKMEEKVKFEEKKLNLKEVIIAMDALTVIVNPKNKISKLTQQQISDIYTGKINNWKEVGGADMKIIAYSRETSSGTYEFFKEHVMDKKNYAATVLNMPATGAIVQSVGQTEGAIGYIGLAYETKEVKQLAVSYDNGKTFVEPGITAAQDGTYPISRPLYFYYSADKESSVKPLVDYILSDEGQKGVLETGYVPLKK
ncbi:PstS family phosphate ABC transporter substrate-binding protein [soil metagenome]